MVKISAWLRLVINWFLDFPSKHPKIAHVTVLAWSLFMTSWGLGTKIPLDEYGFPGKFLDARLLVSQGQALFHLPTVVVGIVTFLINLVVAYSYWKKAHVTSKP